MPLKHPFKLSGKTTDPWAKVTNNQWNNMLSKNWCDNGFHFYSRIRERGPEAGIHSPSDLESEIRNGKVTYDQNTGRYSITMAITNGQGQHFTVLCDYDNAKDRHELVTCVYV